MSSPSSRRLAAAEPAAASSTSASSALLSAAALRTAFVACVLSALVACTDAWQPDVVPKLYIKHGECNFGDAIPGYYNDWPYAVCIGCALNGNDLVRKRDDVKIPNTHTYTHYYCYCSNVLRFTALRAADCIPLAALIPSIERLLFAFCPFADTKVPIFYGNVTDYFKLLAQDEHSLLIGARYVLSCATPRIRMDIFY